MKSEKNRKTIPGNKPLTADELINCVKIDEG